MGHREKMGKDTEIVEATATHHDLFGELLPVCFVDTLGSQQQYMTSLGFQILRRLWHNVHDRLEIERLASTAPPICTLTHRRVFCTACNADRVLWPRLQGPPLMIESFWKESFTLGKHVIFCALKRA